MEVKDLRIKIYADGADPKFIRIFNELELIKGFTTNPTLIKRPVLIL